MSNNAGKGINILLIDSTIEGRIRVEDDDWGDGLLLVSPKDKLDVFFDGEKIDKPGVYFLLSKDKVYVGQSNDLKQRINQHIIGKEWWDRVVFLTNKAGDFDHADIDYLESVFIEKSKQIGTFVSENKNNGNKINIGVGKKNRLDKYIQEALFLLSFIGLNLFEKENGPKPTIVVRPASSKVESRKEAYSVVDKLFPNAFPNQNRNYAKLSLTKTNYWINPKTDCVTKRWILVLNDWVNHELIVLDIPPQTMQSSFAIKPNYLRIRKDDASVLEIKIRAKDFHDISTNADFSPYIAQRITY